jgi:hypothetical protein
MQPRPSDPLHVTRARGRYVPTGRVSRRGGGRSRVFGVRRGRCDRWGRLGATRTWAGEGTGPGLRG